MLRGAESSGLDVNMDIREDRRGGWRVLGLVWVVQEVRLGRTMAHQRSELWVGFLWTYEAGKGN